VSQRTATTDGFLPVGLQIEGYPVAILTLKNRLLSSWSAAFRSTSARWRGRSLDDLRAPQAIPQITNACRPYYPELK
jgi:hypothetical protein